MNILSIKVSGNLLKLLAKQVRQIQVIWQSVLKSSTSNETASIPSTSTPEYKLSGSRVQVPKVM